MKALAKDDIKSLFHDKKTKKPIIYAPIGCDIIIHQIDGSMALCSRDGNTQRFWAHISQLQINKN